MLFHHVCIQTNCYIKSMNFYTKVLGMDIVEETKGFHGRDYNTWLQKDNLMIELQTGKKDSVLAPFNNKSEGLSHICILTDNIENTCSDIKSKGWDNFKIKGGKIIYEVCGGKLFKVIAPEGTIIEFRDNPNL